MFISVCGTGVPVVLFWALLCWVYTCLADLELSKESQPGKTHREILHATFIKSSKLLGERSGGGGSVNRNDSRGREEWVGISQVTHPIQETRASPQVATVHSCHVYTPSSPSCFSLILTKVTPLIKLPITMMHLRMSISASTLLGNIL